MAPLDCGVILMLPLFHWEFSFHFVIKFQDNNSLFRGNEGIIPIYLILRYLHDNGGTNVHPPSNTEPLMGNSNSRKFYNNRFPVSVIFSPLNSVIKVKERIVYLNAECGNGSLVGAISFRKLWKE
ncbi:hypothetical protein NPIL_493131 [Nephila pilipes]|uniref:Uncharacterized protein n=1 Tax=Nephila pilipes TaxID=299642 RepID=A0A8X6PVM5_NEPPI|nr:hypothetical protein NPIL_493131 [Nephila pilipes]